MAFAIKREAKMLNMTLRCQNRLGLLDPESKLRVQVTNRPDHFRAIL